MNNEVIIRWSGTKAEKCLGDQMPVRAPKTLTRTYSLDVRLEFSEAPTHHEHTIVSRPLFDPAKADTTKEDLDWMWDYDEGERWCGLTDPTVRVIASVNGEELDRDLFKGKAWPAETHLMADVPLHFMRALDEYLRDKLPLALLQTVLNLSEEGGISWDQDARNNFITRMAVDFVSAARDRLPVPIGRKKKNPDIGDTEARKKAEERARHRALEIKRLVLNFRKIGDENKGRCSRAALARYSNIGTESNRTQSMNRELKRLGMTWEELEGFAFQPD